MDTSVADPLVGQVLDGRYQVLRRIAAGGMAVVYEALDRRLDRPVALKVMHPWLAADAGLVDRFAREARASARLSDPCVVAVYDQGCEGDRVWLAMEYVEGSTLRDVLRRRGRLRAAEVLEVAVPVLRALSVAHAAGLVHRDVKPENVLVGGDGRIKVADFGLVRAVTAATSTRTDGAVLGSVSYLAPELLERGTADERVDVYATGILLFELLTGSKPFEGDTPLQVAYQHVHDDVPPPSSRVQGVPPALDALVVRATRRNPDQRPRTAGEMLREAQSTRRTLRPGDERTELIDRDSTAPQPRTSTAPQPRTSTAPQSCPPPRTPRVRRRRVLLATLLTLLLAGAGVGYWGPGRYASTPRLAGLPAAAAQHRATQHGFRTTSALAFDDLVTTGEVIASHPGGGRWARKGSTLQLVVSAGVDLRRVPTLVGRTPVSAAALIHAAHLASGAVTSDWSDTVAKGLVSASAPAGGSTLRHDSAVGLTLSKGPKPVAVPRLLGLDADAAHDALTALRLTLSTTEVFSATVPAGSVLSQGTTAGTSVPPGTAVAVVLSKGPELFKVPGVRGYTQGRAIKKLEAAGFTVTTGGVDILHLVLYQSPSAGSLRPRGTVVHLTIT